MPSLPYEIIGVIMGFIGAIVGYAFREYRNRVSPLLEIINIGTTCKRSDKVNIDTRIVETLRDSFYPEEIQPEATLGDVFDIWDRCDFLEKLWPSTKRGIEAVINAESDDDFKSRLSDILRQRFFEKLLIKLLLNNRLDFGITPEILASQERIHTWFDEEQEHKVWFDLPPDARSFGKAIGHPAIRSKLEPFIIAVSRFHKTGIINAFRHFIRIFDADYTKALSCVHDLKNIDNENERWVMRCFLANTSSSPLVVERRGTLTVFDIKTKTKYQEDCYLAFIDKDDKLEDTDTPLVVSGGEGKRFALLTSQKQQEMNLGGALRELYDRKDGKCHISIILRRPGLLRRQPYQSSTAEFSSPTKPME